MATIAEIRSQYPQYQDLSDQQLADALHAKFYADMPREEFDAKVGLAPATTDPGFNPYDTGATKLAGGPGVQPGQSLLDKFGNATMATVNGLSASVPFLQNTTDAIGGTIAQLMGGDYGGYVQRQKDIREGYAQKAPLARVAGEVGGTLAGWNAAGATKLGAEALGMTGNFGQRLGNSVLSSSGLSMLDAMSNGKSGADVLTSGALGGLTGAGGMLAGEAVSKAGGAVTDALTSSAQRGLTAKAVVGAPSSSELKSAASQMFEASTGGKPLMINDNAYFRFLGDVKQVADKFRINSDNDQKSVGLLNTLMRIADETASGTKVDMKDLHLIRQLAGDVAESPEGRNSAFGSTVISKMDDFIRSLKPGDILGGGNPSEAANDLLKGISTWARASKVAAVEKAITRGQHAASGPEKGIRNALRNSIVNDEATWKTFNKAEQQAILDVVDGTNGSNFLKLLGTFGFGGNTATNGVGGALGMMLGNTVAPGIGLVLGPALGAVAKRGSEAMTGGLAKRALGAVATPNIPIAKQAPNLIGMGAGPLEALIRAGGLAGSN